MDSASPQTPAPRPPRHRGWLAGVIMIVLGAAFLANNFGMTIPFPQHWWALFILLAAIGSFWKAWHSYRLEKRFTSGVKGQFMGGLFTGLVAVIFLLDLDWGKVWPLFLILSGLSAVIYPREKDRA